MSISRNASPNVADDAGGNVGQDTNRYYIITSLSSSIHFYCLILFIYFSNHTGDETVSGSLPTDSNAGSAIAGNVDPLDPNFVNFDIDYNDEKAYLALKRRLSVQKDAALIVQRREKAKAFVKMAEAEKEIIR